MRYIFFSIILLHFSIRIFSQNDFREGYVIMSSGDTISEYINYNDNEKYSRCEFKKSPTENFIIYKPSEIIGYRFKDDKFYISKDIELKKNNEIYKQIVFSKALYKNDEAIVGVSYPDSGIIKLKVFLEFILKGKLNIYYFQDNSKNGQYFVEKDSDQIHQLLVEDITYISDNEVYAKQKREVYKGELISILNNYPKAFKEVNNTDLRHKDLIKLGRDYHNYICGDNNCIVYQQAIKPFTTHFNIYAGYGFSNYSLKEGKKLLNFIDKSAIHYGLQVIFKNIFPENEKVNLKIGVS
jgi:hypothetical protein